MFVRITVILFCLLLAPWQTAAVNAGEITVSAAASLKDALNDIIKVFNASQPQVKINTNYGASGALAKQIVQGAPADIFISADNKWMDYLIEEKKGAGESRQVLAYNALVLAGDKKFTIGSLSDLSKMERIAIGSPASVPAGKYAEDAMKAAGVYNGLEQQKKLVMAQDVRQALLYADRGEVDASFVYKTDALMAEKAAILFTVPTNLYSRVTYPMALTASSASNAEARTFFTFLHDPQAIAILQKYGFDTAP